MYRWYKQARRCYLYFNDVKWRTDDPDASRDQLRKSRWFTRGWTLQELLAPQFLECYDKDWISFGDRDLRADDISDATGISFAHLKQPQSACVAVKMSWAAKRETSRIEDMAYCLLGLFDINMPMLYGEGKNAFLRLQRKLIKKTADESIFAWADDEISFPHGMLAPWPRAFAASNDIIATTDPEAAAVRRPYTITNQGLELYVNHPTQQACDGQPLHHFQTITFGLNCESRSAAHGENRYLAIKLHKFGNHWQRVDCDVECLRKPVVQTTFQDGNRKWLADSLSEMTTIYIKQAGS